MNHATPLKGNCEINLMETRGEKLVLLFTRLFLAKRTDVVSNV